MGKMLSHAINYRDACDICAIALMCNDVRQACEVRCFKLTLSFVVISEKHFCSSLPAAMVLTPVAARSVAQAQVWRHGGS